MPLSHPELVEIARTWLYQEHECDPILTDQDIIGLGWGRDGEIPDVIGWGSRGCSDVIECKLSLSDVNADRDKPWRMQVDKGMGQRRTLFVPHGLVDEWHTEDHESAHFGWRHVEVMEDGTYRIVRPGETFWRFNYMAERQLMRDGWRKAMRAGRVMAGKRRANERKASALEMSETQREAARSILSNFDGAYPVMAVPYIDGFAKSCGNKKRAAEILAETIEAGEFEHVTIERPSGRAIIRVNAQ